MVVANCVNLGVHYKCLNLDLVSDFVLGRVVLENILGLALHSDRGCRHLDLGSQRMDILDGALLGIYEDLRFH